MDEPTTVALIRSGQPMDDLERCGLIKCSSTVANCCRHGEISNAGIERSTMASREDQLSWSARFSKKLDH